MLVRWQLERPMYDFKNSFSLAFVYIHRAKFIFSRDMFCLPHFWAKIHGVSVLRYMKALPYQFGLAAISGFRDHSDVTDSRTNRNQLLGIHLIRIETME